MLDLKTFTERVKSGIGLLNNSIQFLSVYFMRAHSELRLSNTLIMAQIIN